MFVKQLRTSIIVLALLTGITGILYTLAVTVIAQVVFPAMANGSLVKRDGRNIGSELIGQPFSDPKYFWGRPSSTMPFPYNASASAGSNFGPLNPALINAEKNRIASLKAADAKNIEPIPVDLVTTSAS